MRRRDKVAVSALRSLLSALANAEAVEHEEADVLSVSLSAVRGSASLCRPDAWA
jgi:hypothetical protein